MINTLQSIFGAVADKDIGNALTTFSTKTLTLLNIVFGALTGILAVATILVLIFYAVKFGHNNVEVAAEAKKRFKAVLLAMALCLLLFSGGLVLVNTLFASIGDTPFDVTGKLLLCL